MDTLNYFLGGHTRRNDLTSLQITHYLSGNNSFYVKSPSQYEWHTWDDKFIYLRQDTSINTVIDGRTSRCYRLDGGIWMKREMEVGDYFEVVPKVYWLGRGCNIIRTWLTWKYYMFLEYAGSMDLGGDIGKEEVIVLKFDYYSAYEKFTYSRRWGWVKWQHYEQNKQVAEVVFNKVSQPILYTPSCGSPKLIVPDTAEKRVGMVGVKRKLRQM